MSACQRLIVLDFAKWTALSALRSDAPMKSRVDAYPLLTSSRSNRQTLGDLS